MPKRTPRPDPVAAPRRRAAFGPHALAEVRPGGPELLESVPQSRPPASHTIAVGTPVSRGPAQIRTCALTHTAPALGRAVAHDGKSFVRPWVSYPQLRPVLVPQCIHFLPGRFVPLRASPQYA